MLTQPASGFLGATALGLMRFVRPAIFAGAAVAAMGVGALPAAADTGVCTAIDDCTLGFTKLNSGVTGTFGTVNLKLTGTHTVTVSIDMGAGIGIITTGFPAGPGQNYSVGFSDTLGGGLTFGDYDPATYASTGTSHAIKDLQFDGFGSFSNGVTTSPFSGGSGTPSNILSFTVTHASLTDVEQLLAGSSNSGGPLFVVDVVGAGGTGVTNLAGAWTSVPPETCANGATNPPLCSNQDTDVPEPMSAALFAAGLVALGVVRRRVRR